MNQFRPPFFQIGYFVCFGPISVPILNPISNPISKPILNPIFESYFIKLFDAGLQFCQTFFYI